MGKAEQQQLHGPGIDLKAPDAATQVDFDPGVSEPHQSHQEIPTARFAPAAKLPGKEEHLYCLSWLLGIGIGFVQYA